MLVSGAAELGRQGRHLPTQLLVVAIEPCSKSTESSLVALVFQDHFWILCHVCASISITTMLYYNWIIYNVVQSHAKHNIVT